MSSQYGNFLRSYDFFGKSIPGIVLLVGLIPLFRSLPDVSELNIESSISLPLLATLVITLVFVGLIVGQFVHTIAVIVEKGLYWGGYTLYNFYYEYIADYIFSIFSDDRCLGKILNFLGLKKFWSIIRPWFARRYWGTLDIFKGHRRLFENSLGWHFDREVNKRQGDTENLTYHGFRAAFDNNFDIGDYEDLAEFGIESPKYAEFRQLYPLVVAEVSRRDGGRATGFQSRYSFCRGMWVVLSIILCLYLAIDFTNLINIQYSPLLLDIPTSTREYLYGGLIVLVSTFMIASGEYKRHYINYLISEFFAEYGKEDGT